MIISELSLSGEVVGLLWRGRGELRREKKRADYTGPFSDCSLAHVISIETVS